MNKRLNAQHGTICRLPGERVYTCTFRGSTCVDLSPRDDAPTSYPFYNRAALRADRAPLKKVERSIADGTVMDW